MGQCFELRICFLFLRTIISKMQFVCTAHKGFRNLKVLKQVLNNLFKGTMDIWLE